MRRATSAALALSCAVAAAVVCSRPRPVQARRSRGAAALGAAYRAFEDGQYRRALTLARKIDRAAIENDDYAAYIEAQSAYLEGDYSLALAQLKTLASDRGSRFRAWAEWRVADCLWQLGRVDDARSAYAGLVAHGSSSVGDPAVARYRMAEADARAGRTQDAIRELTDLRIHSPASVLEPLATRRLLALGGPQAAQLTASQHISRAATLTGDKEWNQAMGELRQVSDKEPADVVRLRDFWTGMTLYHMRHHYDRAAKILLNIYPDMGDRAAEALFHGARALSRADHDAEAITYYQKVVAQYPHSSWAPEAQFLSGWLEFNMGHYKAGLPYLVEMRRRFRKNRWADNALWYIAFSHYLLGDYAAAEGELARLARQGGRLEGGQGQYWHARTLSRMGKKSAAIAEYRGLVGRFPMSWYALLARARLEELGQKIGPFGDTPRDPDRAVKVAPHVDPALAREPLIRRADELIAAGLGVSAGEELERGERSFIRGHNHAAALAVLLDRYRRAGNFHRPWILASSWGGSAAFDAPPRGRARIWWEHSLPLAYRRQVEKWRHLGKDPTYYLYSIMRKESGFNPHDRSYANAIGLLQMIPPTTRRVAKALGIDYTADLLYDPDLNIKTGAWYIGRLLQKFRMQIPVGAGSFNCGPRPVMRWIEENGDRPIDEFVELVSYTQTRGYMKKVTEIYARYLYLYAHKVYEQPLTLNKDYVKNDLIY